MAECAFCHEPLPSGAGRCIACGQTVAAADDVYELPDAEPIIPANWQTAALYTLDSPVRCPHCREPIRTVRVVRMTRTQAPFTSTLPRGGRAITCPQCERVLSMELSTFA